MAVSYDMLLHPELLTNEQLIHVIQERQLRLPNLKSMHRDELLQIFHNYCVPYGQRKYKDSGRGKVLNKTRQLSPEPVKLNVMSNNRKTLHSEHYDRLKPPPDILSGHMKRIKLENNKSVNVDVNICKRKMSVDAVTPTESPPCKKERKPITWP